MYHCYGSSPFCLKCNPNALPGKCVERCPGFCRPEEIPASCFCFPGAPGSGCCCWPCGCRQPFLKYAPKYIPPEKVCITKDQLEKMGGGRICGEYSSNSCNSSCPGTCEGKCKRPIPNPGQGQSPGSRMMAVRNDMNQRGQLPPAVDPNAVKCPSCFRHSTWDSECKH